MLNDDLRIEPLLRNVPDEDGRKILGPVILSTKIGADEKRSISRGRHTRLGLDVAVECYEAPKGTAGRELLDTLRRAAQVASRVVHPNLRRVIDVGARYGLYYLVLEYVPGETARARVDRLGPLSSGEAATIVLHAARGVAAAHTESLAHGSIGPFGVRITPDGKVKVADLGFSRRLPLLPNQDIDRMPLRSDVVALGSLLAFLVTGHSLPMVEETRLRAAFPDLPTWLIELIEQCLGGGEGERPADAAALVRAIEARLQQESSLVEPFGRTIEPVQTKGREELRRLHRDADARSQQLLRARERRAAANDPLPPRPRSEALDLAWGESDLPELLSPHQAEPMLPPKPGSRAPLSSDAPLLRPASAPKRVSSRAAETFHRSTPPPRVKGRRRRWLGVALGVLCIGGALAAIPLWRAIGSSSADGEAESAAAFDALLASLRRAELDFASGADALLVWNQIADTRRDSERWRGAPEKRRLVELRLEQVLEPVAKALQEREQKSIDLRIEADDFEAAARSVAAGSKQQVASRRVELSWLKSSFLADAKLSARTTQADTAIEAVISERATRQVASLELVQDGGYQVVLERHGSNWPMQRLAFEIDVDSEAPLVKLNLPAEGARVELLPAAMMRVEGHASDRSGLRSVALRWRGPAGELALAAQFENGKFRREFPLQKHESGSYTLWILAEDRRGNIARIERKVVVIALPAQSDPAAEKHAPQLELEAAQIKNDASAPNVVATSDVQSATPTPLASSEGIAAVAPSQPEPLKATNAAPLGERAASATDRPAVPAPERIAAKSDTPTIDIAFPELLVPSMPESAPPPAPIEPAFLAHCEPLPPDAPRDERTGLPKRIVLRELGIEMCLVLPPENGEFMMGTYPNAPASVEVASQDHPRKTRIEKPYYLGLYEVLECDWERVMGAEGSRARYAPATRLPATNLSFADAERFVARVNAKLGLVNGVEIPDEVRWEWAARGPQKSLFPWGDAAVAENAQIGARELMPAGSFPAGAALLCGAMDMCGNAKEWCRGRITNDVAERPVLRGGSYLDPLRLASSFHREQPACDDAQPWYGLRLMLRVERID